MQTTSSTRPDYGIDAPGVMRNLLLVGAACLLAALLLPRPYHPFKGLTLDPYGFFWPAGFLIGEGLLFLLYVKFGKFRHRDFMLGMHTWRGDEQVLDVGCGRGLLLAGAAKRLAALNSSGHATGLDIWSNVDMGGNAEAATLHNLRLEGIEGRCTLVSESAAEMSFADESFDLIVSNLCIHNMYDRPTRTAALKQIARVLKPGGLALISDYKLTSEYAAEFTSLGLQVERKRGSLITTFPPLAVVIARKPTSSNSQVSKVTF